jgi:hypothetical protein
MASGGRDLVGSLGARQLARRPLRYTRASLLLMLAMSMGVFSVSYASTWVDSQRDQAQFQVGADLRIEPARGPSALPAWALSSAYGKVDGVRSSMPVERQRLQLQPSTPAGELLALDADAAAQVVSIRSDLTPTAMPSLVRPLVDARPSVSAAAVPGAPQRLRVTATVSLDAYEEIIVDPEAGTTTPIPVDPATLPAPTLATVVWVRDADGLIHRFATEPQPVAADQQEIVIPLVAGTSDARDNVAVTGGTLAFPIEVIGVDTVISLFGSGEAVAGAIGLGGVAASDDVQGEEWRSVDLDAAGRWQIAWSQGPGSPVAVVPSDIIEDRAMSLGNPGPFRSLPGVDQDGHGVTVSFVPDKVAGLAAADLAAIVNTAFLGQTAAQLGDHVSVPLEGGMRRLRIVGAIRSFPTTEGGRAVAIVDLASLALLRFQAAHTTRQPSEWWLAANDRAAAAAVARADSGPFARATVTSRVDRTASLSADPLALGIIGALALGFVVAGLFAVIGLAASAAVSARQRRGEFALLRALGLSGGQLSGWLWLENASLVVVSLLAGTLLGLVIGWVALPYITVTQQASVPFPPVIVETPWRTILVLEAVSAAALALTVIGLAAVLRRAGVGSILRMGGD